MPSPDAPTVSIVIPAYNEQSTIRACVVAAIEQTEPADEILVVYNRLTDATLRILNDLKTEFPDAPLVYFSQNDEQGLVPTRNFGLDRAMGEVLGRIDADTVLEPTWVHEVRRMFADPTVGAATGPMIYYDMPLRRFGLAPTTRCAARCSCWPASTASCSAATWRCGRARGVTSARSCAGTRRTNSTRTSISTSSADIA